MDRVTRSPRNASVVLKTDLFANATVRALLEASRCFQDGKKAEFKWKAVRRDLLRTFCRGIASALPTNESCEWLLPKNANTRDAKLLPVTTQIRSSNLPALGGGELANRAYLFANTSSRSHDEDNSCGGIGPARYDFVHPTQCLTLPPPDRTRSDTNKKDRGCLRHHSLLFIGHSHGRYLAAMLCMALQGENCGELSIIEKDMVEVRTPLDRPGCADAPAVTWVQANYDLRSQLALVQKAPTHIVVSRGEWDMLYNDQDPRLVALEMSQGLVELVRRFPNATVISQLPQYHYKRIPPRTARHPSHYHRAVWRSTCFAEKRVLRSRDITLCAVLAARQQIHAESTSSSTPFRFFDVWTDSFTDAASHFVDALGHHYQDVVLESFVMKLLSQAVCPADEHPRDLTSVQLEELAKGCVRLEKSVYDDYHRSGNESRPISELPSTEEDSTSPFSVDSTHPMLPYMPLEVCACHNPNYAGRPACHPYAGKVAQVHYIHRTNAYPAKSNATSTSAPKGRSWAALLNQAAAILRITLK